MDKSQAKTIRRALEDIGVTLTDVANENGVTPGHVSQVVSGKRPSERIRRAIAERLGWNPWAASRAEPAA